MSMPIVNLPIERMERHKEPGKENYADDRFIKLEVVAELNRCLGGAPLRQADFFVPGDWSYVKVAATPRLISRAGCPRR
jgi:hypothetical protein